MPVEIVMPKLGLTMTEGQVVEWKFSEGESVNKGDVLFIVETEKVTYEVEAPESGVLARILVHENETVPVGTVVGYLAKHDEDFSGIDSKAGPPEKGAEEGTAEEESVSAGLEEDTKKGPASDKGEQLRPKASPLAKKLARAYSVDLSGIKGSGPGGRILRADVERAAEESKKQAEVSSGRGEKEAGEDRVVTFTGMRRTIAKKMLASKVETAQTYMCITVDAGKILEYRDALLPQIYEKHNIRLTITDIMMKITGAAIKEHPVINTRWTDEGVLYLSDVHMGMAMALDEGLIVPVIRNINEKSFTQVALERKELIRKGKNNQFLPDDISGSTFTLSAMGMFGIEQFTANINVPESAILAVGAIVDKPVALNGEIVIRPNMTMTLSYDHRIIDGAEAGKFMQTLKSFTEMPIKIFS